MSWMRRSTRVATEEWLAPTYGQRRAMQPDWTASARRQVHGSLCCACRCRHSALRSGAAHACRLLAPKLIPHFRSDFHTWPTSTELQEGLSRSIAHPAGPRATLARAGMLRGGPRSGRCLGPETARPPSPPPPSGRGLSARARALTCAPSVWKLGGQCCRERLGAYSGATRYGSPMRSTRGVGQQNVKPEGGRP